MKITFEEIKKFKPCGSGWANGLQQFNIDPESTLDMNKEIEVADIKDSDNMLWLAPKVLAKSFPGEEHTTRCAFYYKVNDAEKELAKRVLVRFINEQFHFPTSVNYELLDLLKESASAVDEKIKVILDKILAPSRIRSLSNAFYECLYYYDVIDTVNYLNDIYEGAGTQTCREIIRLIEL